MRFIFALAAVLGLASAHSWVHCGHYLGTRFNVGQIDNSLCLAYPRIMLSRRDTNPTFAADRGYNFQPNNGQGLCDAGTQGIQTTYRPGQKVRVVWPAKNHDAESCTNPFIPDTRMDLYVTPLANSGATSTDQWTKVIDWKTTQLDPSFEPGFQNCPDFCSNTDAAPCFQDFRVPNLPNGQYTFLWYWEFNPGSLYTNCWDVEINSAATAQEPGDAPLPTPAPTAAPSAAPGGGNPGNGGGACTNGAANWEQCGGRNHGGPTCCSNTGYTCVSLNEWYSQCRPRASLSESDGVEHRESNGVMSFAIGAGAAVGAAAVLALAVVGVRKFREARVSNDAYVQTQL